ncbi:vacuolar sorting protein [Scheffersomyces xylosifermentans]|uniref:vacuolar sorting protein n=1 Tax=Scheffersomyces xylosifermentans TaxID=1304137 RepID=UPI00315CEC8C
MASAMPYNPDDFENNNPFAEPTEQANGEDSSEDNEEEDNISRDSAGNPHNNDEHTNQQGKLTEAELRKLVPERFTEKYSINIRLHAIEKNKSGNPILKFDVAVKGLPRYRQTKYKDVRRTYNEVVKFNKYLTISNLEVFVPVIPSATTSYPPGGEDETKQLLLVWQEWFTRITSNPILVRDEEFVYFIENDFGYSVINTNRKTSVASGLVRKTLKQLALPYDPYEELAEFRPLIKAAYLSCQKLYKLFDRNSKTEKQLSIHIFDLSNKLSVLAQFENSHPGMRNMWEKLGKIVQIQSDLTLIESINEMGSLGDGFQCLANDFYQIKEALTNRHLIMRELTQAEAQTQTRHQNATRIKNKSSLDPIKVDEAIRSLEYATKAEESLNLQVKRISGEMLFERDEIINFTEKKLQKMLKQYTLNKVDYHRRNLKHLENIRLDIRIVDQKGGLSRLNRDNLTTLKHNLTQSQAASGDSWSSRTFRSLKKEEEERESRLEKEEEEEEERLKLAAEEGGADKNIVDAKSAASLLGVATF